MANKHGILFIPTYMHTNPSQCKSQMSIMGKVDSGMASSFSHKSSILESVEGAFVDILM